MKTLCTLLVGGVLWLASCTTVDPGHQTRSGKKAYAAKAPRNRSAWK